MLSLVYYMLLFKNRRTYFVTCFDCLLNDTDGEVYIIDSLTGEQIFKINSYFISVSQPHMSIFNTTFYLTLIIQLDKKIWRNC